jgi:uncharacterized PurR-regulated membrane protein YhhQ (DUF165 family)
MKTALAVATFLGSIVAANWLSTHYGLVPVVAGPGLSVMVSDGRIAVASGLAFLVSEFVDMAVYTPLRKRSRAWAVVASSIVSAPVDTVLFLWVSGFGVTWPAIEGQFLVKAAIGAAVALLLAGWRWSRRDERAVPVYAEPGTGG